MAFDAFKITKYPNNYGTQAGNQNAYDLTNYGHPAQKQGLQNLYAMLQSQGRVDPRLLALAQSENARSTQGQQGDARAMLARQGFGNSGLGLALQASIGSAGANRASNLRYQDIADSYQRNQENLGLLGQLVTNPSLGYGNIGMQEALGRQSNINQQKQGVLGFAGGLLGGAGKLFGL